MTAVPNTKEIKSHIESVKDTKKITNAMYLIASAKMRKAKAELDRTRPYFTAVKSEMKRIFRSAPDVKSPYFYPEDKDHSSGAFCCLVITADKGLAGAYNMNVIRKAEELISEHENTKLFVVGEFGRQYFAKKKIPVEKSFLYTAQNPTVRRAREIADILLELYDAQAVSKIYIVYTDWKNGMSEETVETRLLPFHRNEFANAEEKEVKTPFEFLNSVDVVLRAMVPSYLSGFIYAALVDSFCCEQNSRMTAMDSANRNAEKILSELSVQYNRVRQAAITQEITEVSAGARAQKAKKEAAELE